MSVHARSDLVFIGPKLIRRRAWEATLFPEPALRWCLCCAGNFVGWTRVFVREVKRLPAPLISQSGNGTHEQKAV